MRVPPTNTPWKKAMCPSYLPLASRELLALLPCCLSPQSLSWKPPGAGQGLPAVGLAQVLTPWGGESLQPWPKAGTQLGRRSPGPRLRKGVAKPPCVPGIRGKEGRSLQLTESLCSHTDLGSNPSSGSSPLCALHEFAFPLCAVYIRVFNIH